MPRFPPDTLARFAHALLASRFPSEDARITGDALVRADCQGYPGHGVGRISSYLVAERAGHLRGDARPEVLRQGRLGAVVDGHLALGPACARLAIDVALESAERHGVGLVGLRRAGHVGRLAEPLERAGRAGRVAFAFASVGGGRVPAYGSVEARTSTNPLAAAVPVGDDDPIVLDLATSALSMGDVQARAGRGEPAPPGALLAADGAPTTDPSRFLGPPRGLILPFGGHKGGALNLLTELLGGLWSGNGPGMTWTTQGGAIVNGATFLVVDVAELADPATFATDVRAFARSVRESAPAPGVDRVRLPGDRARARELAALRDGVTVSDAAWTSLLAEAERAGIKPPVPS